MGGKSIFKHHLLGSPKQFRCCHWRRSIFSIPPPYLKNPWRRQKRWCFWAFLKDVWWQKNLGNKPIGWMAVAQIWTFFLDGLVLVDRFIWGTKSSWAIVTFESCVIYLSNVEFREQDTGQKYKERAWLVEKGCWKPSILELLESTWHVSITFFI